MKLLREGYNTRFIEYKAQFEYEEIVKEWKYNNVINMEMDK